MDFYRKSRLKISWLEGLKKKPVEDRKTVKEIFDVSNILLVLETTKFGFDSCQNYFLNLNIFGIRLNRFCYTFIYV